jgi:hypothetical protein
VVGKESVAIEIGLRVSREAEQRSLVGDKVFATCSPVSESLMADMLDALARKDEGSRIEIQFRQKQRVKDESEPAATE